MYLARERPWRASPTVAAESAPAAAPEEEQERAAGKKRRGRGGRGERSGRSAEPADGAPDALEESPPPVVLTVAERRPVWRGAEVALPPARHDFDGERDGRPLSEQEIAEAVQAQSKGIVDCMISAAGQAELRATVTVKLLVKGDGQVSRHRVHAPLYLFEHGLAPCVERAVARLRFPATGGFTLVTAPFQLG
jgi:hypothetical protein